MLFQALTLYLACATAFAAPSSARRSQAVSSVAGRLLLVGGYNRTTEVLRFNPFVFPNTLELVSTSDGGDAEDKAWLSRHPVNPSILLSVNDNGGANVTGYVASFFLDPQGGITFVDHKNTGVPLSPTFSVDPAHTTFFPSGKVVGVANYNGQTAATFRFDPITARFGEQINNGSILDFAGYTPVAGQDPVRQATAHPHMIVPHPWLEVLYIPDLGEDLVRRFAIGEGGILSPLEPYKQTLGSGPRHAAISSNGEYLYLAHELSVEVTVYKIDTHSTGGDLSLVQEHVQIYPSNTTFLPNISAAEIHVSNDGRFLYASTRNLTDASLIAPTDPSDTVAVWSIDHATGMLTREQDAMAVGARQIRSFELSPAHSTPALGGEDFLVVGGLTTNTTQVFKRDKTDGTLTLAAGYTNGFGPSTFIWV